MSKMIKMDDHVRCLKCCGEDRIAWVSQNGKLATIKCTRYHGHINPPTKIRGKKCYDRTETKAKKEMVFLIKVG